MDNKYSEGYENQKELVIDVVNRAFLTRYTGNARIEIISDTEFAIKEQRNRTFYWKNLNSFDGQTMIWISEADLDRYFHDEAVWNRVCFSMPDMAVVKFANSHGNQESISCTVATPTESMNYQIPTITVSGANALSIMGEIVARFAKQKCNL